jgi:hypothetical protein
VSCGDTQAEGVASAKALRCMQAGEMEVLIRRCMCLEQSGSSEGGEMSEELVQICLFSD